MSPRALAIAASVFEIGIFFSGLVLLWRLVLSPNARRQPATDRLPRWQITLRDFFFFVWLVFGGVVVGSAASSLFLRAVPLAHDAKMIAVTVASQIGMLLGLGLFKWFFDRHPPGPPVGGVIKAGLATFLIALPVVALVNVAWQGLLRLGGIPTEKQDLIRMFLEANSPAFVALMVILACVGAPLTEELIFRGGLFRYFRMRVPRWVALVFPSCVFAAMHANLAIFAPLVALGIIFSLAYERTGSIRTSMVAHALFNLNSVIVIFADANI
jgi:uncharacterized protein